MFAFVLSLAVTFYSPYLSEYKDTFNVFDKEGDGKIACRNLADICRALGWNPTNGAVKQVAGDKDAGGYRVLSSNDFLNIYFFTYY